MKIFLQRNFDPDENALLAQKIFQGCVNALIGEIFIALFAVLITLIKKVLTP
jgi:hypothetical protein